MTLRARDIADLCDELALERASVTVMAGWDPNDSYFVLVFGPKAYPHTIDIDPKSDLAAVKATLEAARASPLPEASVPAPEAKPSPAAILGPAKGKRKSNVSSRP